MFSNQRRPGSPRRTDTSSISGRRRWRTPAGGSRARRLSCTRRSAPPGRASARSRGGPVLTGLPCTGTFPTTRRCLPPAQPTSGPATRCPTPLAGPSSPIPASDCGAGCVTCTAITSRPNPCWQTSSVTQSTCPPCAQPAPRRQWLAQAEQQLARGWQGNARQIRHAIAIALDFHTWQILVRQRGLSRSQVIRLMLAMVEGAGCNSRTPSGE